MTSPEYSHDQLATPEQASTLLSEVGTLTTLQGKNYGDRNTYGTPVADMPEEVAKHLTAPSETSGEVKNSAYIVQIFDRETGQPKRDGVVGMVTFTRNEKPDPNLSYAAHVGYRITTADGGGTYGVVRYVTNTEHGPHEVLEMQQKLGRAATDPRGAAEDMLQELQARERLNQTRPVEQAMGMFDVTQAEVQQVIGFVESLNGEQ